MHGCVKHILWVARGILVSVHVCMHPMHELRCHIDPTQAYFQHVDALTHPLIVKQIALDVD